MREDWDQRARENARYYVASGQEQWNDEEYFRSGGDQRRARDPDRPRQYLPGQGPAGRCACSRSAAARGASRARWPSCSARFTRVDISGEMVRQARLALRDFPNAHVFQNNGTRSGRGARGDRRGVPLDFAFSYIVFQHIPSREVIENYVREVHGLLRPGALFKFQVQGFIDDERAAATAGWGRRSPKSRRARWRSAAASRCATTTAPATSTTGCGSSRTAEPSDSRSIYAGQRLRFVAALAAALPILLHALGDFLALLGTHRFSAAALRRLRQRGSTRRFAAIPPARQSHAPAFPSRRTSPESLCKDPSAS